MINRFLGAPRASVGSKLVLAAIGMGCRVAICGSDSTHIDPVRKKNVQTL